MLVVKNLPANAGDARDMSSIPGSGRSPGVGNGTPLQYSCLEKSMGRGSWRATVHGAAKGRTWLSDFHFHFHFQTDSMGFPGGAGGKEPACQCRSCKICEFNPWVRKIPWRWAWQPTPVFLPGESHGQRSMVGYSPWGSKKSNTTERASL